MSEFTIAVPDQAGAVVDNAGTTCTSGSRGFCGCSLQQKSLLECSILLRNESKVVDMIDLNDNDNRIKLTFPVNTNVGKYRL